MHRPFPWIWIPLCLILTHGAILHGKVLQGDWNLMYGNPLLRDPGNIPVFFTDPSRLRGDPGLGGQFQRPLTLSLHALSYPLPRWAIRLPGLLLHALSVWMVYLLLLRFWRAAPGEPTRWAPLAGALAFAVHPLQTEALNFLTARSTLLSTALFFLALWAWTRFRETGGWGCYGLSLGCYILAALAKETTMVFPLLIVLWDLYARPGPSPEGRFSRKPWRTWFPYLPPFLIALAPYAVYRLTVAGHLIPRFQRDLWTQIYTAPVTLTQYWEGFLIPYPLSLFHPNRIFASPWHLPVWMGVGVVLLLILVALWTLRDPRPECRALGLAALWPGVVLAPILLFPLNHVFQENRGYPALFAVSLVMAAGVAWVSRRSLRQAGLLLIMWVVLWSGLSIHRHLQWRDPLAFLQREVRLHPQSAFALGELGREALAQKQYPLARSTLEQALRWMPRAGYLWLLLGDALRAQGDIPAAIQAYERGLRLDPRSVGYYQTLALLYADQGRLQEALPWMKRAVRRQPRYFRFHYNLGILFARMGQWEKAQAAFERALRLNPAHLRSLWGVARSLEAQGKRAEARAAYRRVAQEAERQGWHQMAQDALAKVAELEGGRP